MTADLKSAIAAAATGTDSRFTNVNGGWYYINKGWYNSNEYFFQFGVPVNTFNADVTITLTSINTQMVQTTTSSDISIPNSDGSLSL